MNSFLEIYEKMKFLGMAKEVVNIDGTTTKELKFRFMTNVRPIRIFQVRSD